ncbi:Tetratricopeptide repeat-containing protein [Granulicella rosea]|uniref:Tetratricopeptide repeat-containing protein n=1 Tax=Granulicella rosea TaxID=474952 RepID=A0A239EXS0_9BACT|nr:tetratricopeptide repeat protein [Granulicella rosea]SNS48833.1 Tetratricopeptide repeat-containing protein [Granulicella rosea]
MAHVKTASSTPAKRTPRTLAGVAATPQDEARVQAIALYEAAIRLMQEGKYEKAHAAFDKMLAGAPGDLADRVRMYINACLLQVAKGKTTFTSHEEQYDYAISLLNNGHYDDAREQFRTILSQKPSADYAFYGLAVLSSMTGDSHTCLEHLTEAIRQNPRNRIQARSDSDFQDMADDPRFTELLYPEA